MGLELLVSVGVAGRWRRAGGGFRLVASCTVVVLVKTALHGVQSHAWTFLKTEFKKHIQNLNKMPISYTAFLFFLADFDSYPRCPSQFLCHVHTVITMTSIVLFINHNVITMITIVLFIKHGAITLSVVCSICNGTTCSI